MWDDIFNNYFRTYRRPYTTRRFDNFYVDLYRMMEEALDEVEPKPEPPKPEFKIVSTKTVKRNGNTYRVTVEKLSDSEESDDTPEVQIDESAEDFDEDTKNDMA